MSIMSFSMSSSSPSGWALTASGDSNSSFSDNNPGFLEFGRNGEAICSRWLCSSVELISVLEISQGLTLVEMVQVTDLKTPECALQFLCTIRHAPKQYAEKINDNLKQKKERPVQMHRGSRFTVVRRDFSRYSDVLATKYVCCSEAFSIHFGEQPSAAGGVLHGLFGIIETAQNGLPRGGLFETFFFKSSLFIPFLSFYDTKIVSSVYPTVG